MNENNKNKKQDTQSPIPNKIQHKDNSMQEIKTINKRLLQHNNIKRVLTAYVPTESLLTGHFNNKAKTTQSFLIHPSSRPQSKYSNENDREFTQPFIHNSAINTIKISANGKKWCAR